MDDKSNKFIPFIIGLFFGWVGVPLMVNLVYLSIIASLIVALVLKK